MKRLLLLLLPIGTFAQIPKYYEGIEFRKENKELQTDLADLVTASHKNVIRYTPGVWNVLLESDLDPNDANKVLLIYGYDDNLGQQYHRTRKKEDRNTGGCGNCYGRWEREHVFPKSLANPKLDESSPGSGTDAHNLRAVDRQMNSWRSNNPYRDGSGNANLSNNGFYPGDEWIGDIARILMYMNIRYKSQCDPNNVVINSTNTISKEIPDLLLKWNAIDPPSEFEKVRNEIISETQGNRNPFIDNPYIATITWGGPTAVNSWNGYLSTDDFTTKEKISVDVYPNPTSDVVKINANSFIKANVYNLNGQLIYSSDQKEINLASYPNGIYIIAVHLENGAIETRKIIKK